MHGSSYHLLPVALVTGHVLLGVIFVRGGIVHFMNVAGVAQEIAERGVPFPRVALVIGSASQIVFGAMLMAGFSVTLSALLLVIFTIAASWMMLDFWNKEGAEKAAAKTNFESNVAIVGGLLVAAALGA